jgi:hypothetical protein
MQFDEDAVKINAKLPQLFYLVMDAESTADSQ